MSIPPTKSASATARCRSWILFFTLAAAAAGCGRSGSSTESTSSPTPTPAPAPPVGFSFVYDDAVAAETRATVESAAGLARSFFQSRFGETLHGTVTMTVRAASGPNTGLATPGAVLLNSLNTDWTNIGGVTRRKIIIHELFHVFQYDTQWLPNLDDDRNWVREGAAEYVGYAAVIDAGMMPYDEVKSCQTEKYFAFNGPTLPELDAVTFPMPGTYPMGWLAMDRLLAGLPGVPTLAGFWRAGGSDWRRAFQSAFATSAAAFTSDFAQYRRTLTRPSAGTCARFER